MRKAIYNTGTSMTSNPIVDLIVGLAWPIVLTGVVVMFRAPVTRLIDRIKKVEIEKGRLSLEIQPILDQSATEARNAAKPPEQPTTAELERGEKIAAADIGWPRIRVAAIERAVEYDTVRATMPSSEDRTKALTGIIAKMRTLGASVFPYRYEFVDAASPGQRLLVIAALQVTPDLDLCRWLRDRILQERPFLGFHAIGALRRALTAPAATHERTELKAIINEIDQNKNFQGDSDRESAFKSLVDEASRI